MAQGSIAEAVVNLGFSATGDAPNAPTVSGNFHHDVASAYSAVADNVYTSGAWIGDGHSGRVNVAVENFSFISFQTYLTTAAVVGGFGGPVDGGGTATADFWNTFNLTGIDALDAQGHSIVNDAGLSFDSGTQYFLGNPNVTTTSEPASMALLGAGLLGHARNVEQETPLVRTW